LKKHIIIISVLCVIALAVGYWSSPEKQGVASRGDANSIEEKEPDFLQEGLVAYYTLDDVSSKVEDSSGIQNHGKLTGPGFSSVLDRFGGKDKALEFSGEGGRINIENHPSLQFKDQLTISVWLLNPGINSRGGLISNGDPSIGTQAYTWGLCVGPNGDSKHCFSLWNGKGSNKDYFVKLDNWEIPKRESWNHLIAVYGKRNAVIYLNGEILSAVRTSEEFIGKNTHPISIGMNDYNSFAGRVDDLRIYNRALSQEEVKALYELEKPKNK